jgi:hypothetical protein
MSEVQALQLGATVGELSAQVEGKLGQISTQLDGASSGAGESLSRPGKDCFLDLYYYYN